MENWRLEETSKIHNAEYSVPEKLTALAGILDQEATIIHKIDFLKSEALEKIREDKTLKAIEKVFLNLIN